VSDIERADPEAIPIASALFRGDRRVACGDVKGSSVGWPVAISGMFRRRDGNNAKGGVVSTGQV
jgi:hypothetical protein